MVELSVYGCRLAIVGPHSADTRVWLRLDGSWPIAATVVSTDRGEIACRFDKPIPNILMRELTRG